ncbi:cation:dicarboxylate symporter family transporter [Campylobacter canadensis]|uniref:Cation:dicarboxylase symporter family transporter n=1 Tax=Campylobacter canadensis TaxID=449520 RepID=A0ABS7WVK3_9BACT|nr:cation:dicarboxylase symporter family transporter [Campylobacter canadensis]MBZ7988069.1 cation:dicarboxylase symporter family transporter [Campylobacter canadensis]MBZ7999032.1 cation:dicarboxylase symporter family transporter [Campylobacter canadensis]
MQEFFMKFFNFSEPLAILFLFIYAGICFLLNRLSYNVNLSTRMMVALVIGLLFGFLAQLSAAFPDKSTDVLWLEQVRIWLAFVVSIFVSLLKLMIVPIVFFGISSSLLNIDNKIKIKSLLARSVFWLIFTSVIASLIGVFLGYIFNLGASELVESTKSLKESRTLSAILLGLMPQNILKAMSENNIVGVILVAFLFSMAARKLALKEEFKEAFNTYKTLILFINKIIMSVVNSIITIMPYVIVAMIANVLIANGFNAIKQAGLFIILTYVAGILMLFVYAILLLLHGLNPISFYKRVFPNLLIAFTSRSSAGVLPITISTLQKKLGVSENTANFTAGLGATIGMCGCAGYYVGLVAIYLLNSVNIPLSISYVILIAIITIIGSLSIAGIPGIAIVAASIMITGLGLEQHFYLLAVVLAIDPIIDMVRTMSNVNGALCAAVFVDKEEKNLTTFKENYERD